LEIVVGMLESNFLIQPCAIQVQILIKTKLWGNFLINSFSTRQLWETHWAFIWFGVFLPSSLDFPIDVGAHINKTKKWFWCSQT
jgi:hypothetical protein